MPANKKSRVQLSGALDNELESPEVTGTEKRAASAPSPTLSLTDSDLREKDTQREEGQGQALLASVSLCIKCESQI